MKIEIRLAQKNDAENLSYLGKKTFEESFGHLFSDKNDLIDYFDQTFSVEKIRNSIDKDHNIYWIIFDMRIPIGYAKLQLNTRSEFLEIKASVCKLQNIYIEKLWFSRNRSKITKPNF